MEHKIHRFESKILVDETIEYYGYHPDKWKESSGRFVLASCRWCGKIAEIRKCFFKKSGSACHKNCRLEEQAHFSPFKNADIQKKVRSIIKEKYGVEYASQNPSIARKISLAHSKNSFPPAFHDLTEKLLAQKIDFLKDHQTIIIPQKLSISCHWNADLIKTENSYSVRDQTKDYNKRGMHVFHIFEHQWNVRSKQIWNFIKSNLGLNVQKIMARKCRIDYSEQPLFIEHNHIQGKPVLVIRYFNLIYNGEVVASMTASKHHRQNSSKQSVVLSRLCFADKCNVQGGASKLFKAFIDWSRSNNYNSIISWSDNAWTVGRIYSVLGFNLQKEYGPDYFYWNPSTKEYVSKQSQQKKKTNCPDGMTEREWCLNRGLFRIWDCGKKLWMYNLA